MTLPIHSSASPSPERLSRLLAELTELVSPAVSPVALEVWRQAVVREWSTRRRSTRDRMAQALSETIALLGPGATTASLSCEVVAALAARAGRSATTDGLLSSLRAACHYGIRRGWIAPRALEGARWKAARTDAPRRRHHGRAEIARVLELLRSRSESWHGGRLYALAAVYAYAGLRAREALRLRRDDVRLDVGILAVWPNGGTLKTPGSEAPVPMPRALRSILAEWLARDDHGSEWVFPGAKRRGPWLGGMCGRRPTDRLVAAGLEAGVEGFTPLSLRHSLATHLASFQGLSTKQIRMILRHSSDATQAHYIHPDLANLVGLVGGFDYAADAPAPPPERRARPRHRLLIRRRPRRPV